MFKLPSAWEGDCHPPGQESLVWVRTYYTALFDLYLCMCTKERASHRHTYMQSFEAQSSCTLVPIPHHPWVITVCRERRCRLCMCKSGSLPYLKLTLPSVRPMLLFDRRDAWDSRLNWDSRLLLDSKLPASLG